MSKATAVNALRQNMASVLLGVYLDTARHLRGRNGHEDICMRTGVSWASGASHINATYIARGGMPAQELRPAVRTVSGEVLTESVSTSPSGA